MFLAVDLLLETLRVATAGTTVLPSLQHALGFDDEARLDRDVWQTGSCL